MKDALLTATDDETQPLTKDLKKAINNGGTIATAEEGNKDYAKYGGKCKQITLFMILLLANVLGPLSTEAQVPALEEIAVDLNTTSQLVQLSITLYMLFFGASQLVFGSLSDVYGRRRTLLGGLFVYTLTNVGCALAPNVILLNIFRCLQAMGSGTCMVVPNAIATDVFDYVARTRVLAILNSIRVIIIVASPIYGGIVTTFLGWRYIFWIIGALSAVLLIVTLFVLPETLNPETVQIRSVRDYFDTIKLLVRHRVFVGLMLVSGSVYAGVFIMFNEFSFVMSERYGHDTFEVTLLFGFVIIGLLIGSILSAVVTCFRPKNLIAYSIFQIFGCGVVLILPFIVYAKTAPIYVGLNEYWTLAPLCLYVGSDGLMMAPLMSTAVEPFRSQAGTANALSLFWRFFCGAVLALIICLLSEEHLYVLHFGIAGMAIVSALIFLFVLFPAKFPQVMRKGGVSKIEQETAAATTTIGDESLSNIRVEEDDDNEVDDDDDRSHFIPIKDGSS